MAASLHVCKFVTEPNTHLLCNLCSGVFTNPVINVSCGHSFCAKCLKTALSCPQDSAPLDAQSQVINRALKSQVDDLDVYCSHGLQWDETKRDYVAMENGCALILKLGEQAEHERICEHGTEPCPNNPSECGAIRRKDFEEHRRNCSFNPCAYVDRGCEFRGSQVEIDQHSKTCQHKSFESVIVDQQTEAIVANNKALVTKVKRLEDKMTNIESENVILKSQLVSSNESLKQMGKRLQLLEVSVSKLSNDRELSEAPKPSRPYSLQRQSRLSSRISGHETWLMPFQFKCIGTLRGHKQAVSCLAQHGSLLISSGSDHSIKIWDADDLSKGCRQTLTGHKSPVECLTVGGVYFYCAGADFEISVWSLADFTSVKNIKNAHENQITAMTCANDRLFSSSHTLIKIWDAVSMETVHSISGLHHWVRSLAFNPQKDKLYSGSHNTIEVWNCSTKYNLTGKISHTYGSVHALVVTGKYIIAGTYNNNTHVYDVVTQKHVSCLNGHLGCISGLVVSPSGRFLFTASADSHVQVWNMENMLPIQSLTRHEGSVNALVLHGDLLFTGSEDSEIKVFRHFKMDMGFNPK